MRLLTPILAAALAAPVAALPAMSSASATPDKPVAQKPYSMRTLTFTVTVPNESVAGGAPQTCTIVGDLFKPTNASATHRVPAILTTNGFGGSKADQDDLGRLAASHGYAVLSYSGLGFGGSGCKISLDDPSYDGVAGRQLVSFLGGAKGIATDAAGKPVSIGYVKRDRVAHDGKHHRHDPRVGMIGGSYGGQIQFAVASVDPRLDTIIPIITWNDLAYSLAPNNTGFTHGVTYRNDAPGTEKFDWVSLFFGLGIVDGIQGATIDPARNVGCPNFLTEACTAKAELDAGGFATQDVIDFARHASVESYIKKIRIPTLLAQGQADTLFNLNEAAATYHALKRQGTPVKMIWQSWGHSNGTAAKGEYSDGTDALTTYEGQRFFAWFDHYLKGRDVGTGPGFAYYREWVPFTGKGPDTVQYAAAPSYPVGHRIKLFLSGSDKLVRHSTKVTKGSASYVNVGAGVPTSYSETSEFQGNQIPDENTPPTDAPGTFAKWTSSRLAHHLDVVGIPRVHLRVSAPTTSSAAPATQLQLFAKIYDIAKNGDVDLVHRLVAPVRVPDATKPFTVTLPGIVHRFRAGHRIALVLAATDAAYKNSYAVQPVTVTTTPTHPGVLSLPVVSSTGSTRSAGQVGASAAATAPRHSATAGSPLPDTGGSPWLPVAGAAALFAGLAGVGLRRRRQTARGR